MLASEIIKRLEDIIEEHEDVIVVVPCFHGDNVTIPVTNVKYRDGTHWSDINSEIIIY